MICKYETRIVAACPVDDKPDVYDAIFENDDAIQVERILELTAKYAVIKAYQELITSELARDLRCKVTTVGYHSGVKTTVVAP